MGSWFVPIDTRMNSATNKADQALITGGQNDPFLPQLLDAINGATEINITVAFIRHSGLEWNLRVDYPADSAKFLEIVTKFDILFADPQVIPMTHAWIDGYAKRRKVLLRVVSGEPEEKWLPATPTGIQVEALSALRASRSAGYRRGLVVLATGLGKTWLAAFDAQQFKAGRVLFVAHRKEILMQAEDTFTRIQPQASLGYYTGQAKDGEADLVFASIQTL